MADVCIRATSRSDRLEILGTFSTQVCRDAQLAHELAPTSAIALGRLLTGLSLVVMSSKRDDRMSMQLITRRHIGQVYADVTSAGHVRGFVKNRTLSFPVTDTERESGRRSVRPAVFPGEISVIRSSDTGEYTQSSVPLETGEIDEDIEHFLQKSDQIPTALVADTIVNDEGVVILGGGILVQALPDGNLERLDEIRTVLRTKDFSEALRSASNTLELLKSFFEDVEPVELPTLLQWKCRCSMERVTQSLRMFSPTDLAEMAEAGESVNVDCDMCGKSYEVPPSEIARAFRDLIKAQG